MKSTMIRIKKDLSDNISVYCKERGIIKERFVEAVLKHALLNNFKIIVKVEK